MAQVESKGGGALPMIGAIAFGIVGAKVGDGAGLLVGLIIGALWGGTTTMWFGLLPLPIEMIRRIFSAIITTTVVSIIAMLVALAAVAK